MLFTSVPHLCYFGTRGKFNEKAGTPQPSRTGELRNELPTTKSHRGFSDYMTAPDEAIEMSNNERSLEPLEMVINGQKARPKDAAFLSNSLRQFLGIKS